MSDAIKMNKVQFLLKAPIDAYGAGGFRFLGTCYQGSILCLPSGFYSIDFDPNNIEISHLQDLYDHQDEINLLLIGTGENIIELPNTVINNIKRLGISVDIMATGSAVRTYNVLLAEDRLVGALLYPV